MRKLYMKQKVFSLTGRFTVTDAGQQPLYDIEGSFLRIPKSFTMYNEQREEVARITKKVLALLPKFFVEVNGQELVTIKKEFTFLKARYTIDAVGIEVRGNWWDMTFDVLQQGQVIGSVQKKWLSWGDSYEVNVLDTSYETLIVALVVAIDCVKSDQQAAMA